MEFLKITATNGTSQLIPDNAILNIGVDAPTAPVSPSQPYITGRITSVKYQSVNTGALGVTEVTVTAYTGSNVKYEYGCLLPSGQFNPYLKN